MKYFKIFDQVQGLKLWSTCQGLRYPDKVSFELLVYSQLKCVKSGNKSPIETEQIQLCCEEDLGEKVTGLKLGASKSLSQQNIR